MNSYATKTFTLLLPLCFVLSHLSAIFAQTKVPSIDNLYHLTFKGSEITINGKLNDWADAQWVYMSVDHPAHRYVDPRKAKGTMPATPNDGSAWFAMKIDSENIYFAARVRDENAPLINEKADVSDLLLYDHLSVYLGLYDIGTNAYSSPHTDKLNAASGFYLTDPSNKSTIYTESTYRITNAVDNSDKTLGPDYHLGIRAVSHKDSAITGTGVVQHNFGYIDNSIANTTASIQLWQDKKGYNLEWKVPLSSLSGKIANPDGKYANFEWPSFTPKDGMIISFDVEVGDADKVEGGNVDTELLRLGTSNNLSDNSDRFGYRAKLVDLSSKPNNTPRWTYLIDYAKTQDVVLDANLNDWADASFWGLNQDHPLFTEIQGIPASPNDFSGYIALKMDSDHLYVAVRVRDEGTPMIGTLNKPNLAWNYDHVSVYLGLYDISDVASNPHVEVLNDGKFYLYNSKGDTVRSGRTYRIKKGGDNTSSTRGADYQIWLRAIDYGTKPTSKVQTWSGALVDSAIHKGTEAVSVLTGDEEGYIMEWKIPFASLSGDISKSSGDFSGIEWPLFTPKNGTTISFDADLTDRDERDEKDALNRFFRMGDKGALWRDSKSFTMRGLIVDAAKRVGVSNELVESSTNKPYSLHLSQNYPNPFNPSTNIEFYMPQAGELSLEVFNLLGQKVATITNGFYAAGTHSMQFNASTLSSGVYVLMLRSSTQVRSRKFTLIK
jgi:hypothetical protein